MIWYDIIIMIIFGIVIIELSLVHIKIFWKSVSMFKSAKNTNVFNNIKSTEDLNAFVDSMKELMEKKKENKKKNKEEYERGMYR